MCVCVWIMTIAGLGLKVKVKIIGQVQSSKVNAVCVTSIIDRGQFFDFILLTSTELV